MRAATRAALCLSALLLCACADARAAARADDAAAAATTLPDAQARQLVHDWQRQLADYIATAGDGDPAVLARLPAQRATGTLRPARISFGVLDLDARVAEADGFDVQGLLLATPARRRATCSWSASCSARATGRRRWSTCGR